MRVSKYLHNALTFRRSIAEYFCLCKSPGQDISRQPHQEQGRLGMLGDRNIYLVRVTVMLGPLVRRANELQRRDLRRIRKPIAKIHS